MEGGPGPSCIHQCKQLHYQQRKEMELPTHEERRQRCDIISTYKLANSPEEIDGKDVLLEGEGKD